MRLEARAVPRPVDHVAEHVALLAGRPYKVEVPLPRAYGEGRRRRGRRRFDAVLPADLHVVDVEGVRPGVVEALREHDLFQAPELEGVLVRAPKDAVEGREGQAHLHPLARGQGPAPGQHVDRERRAAVRILEVHPRRLIRREACLREAPEGQGIAVEVVDEAVVGARLERRPPVAAGGRRPREAQAVRGNPEVRRIHRDLAVDQLNRARRDHDPAALEIRMGGDAVVEDHVPVVEGLRGAVVRGEEAGAEKERGEEEGAHGSGDGRGRRTQSSTTTLLSSADRRRPITSWLKASPPSL